MDVLARFPLKGRMEWIQVPVPRSLLSGLGQGEQLHDGPRGSQSVCGRMCPPRLATGKELPREQVSLSPGGVGTGAGHLHPPLVQCPDCDLP